MNKLNPRGYLGRQDWLWWALTTAAEITAEEHLAAQGRGMLRITTERPLRLFVKDGKKYWEAEFVGDQGRVGRAHRVTVQVDGETGKAKAVR
jgi:hypothetical protein